MPENRMGTEPIGKLLFKLSAPLMISNLVQSLYNIVDSMFVAMINEDALTAVTLAFPIQMLVIAFAIGTSVGMSALLSRYLGAGLQDKVNKVAHNGMLLAVVNYIIFFIIGFFARPFFAMQTESERIIQYGTDYLSTVCWLSIGVMIQITFERLLQSTGKTKYILYTQSMGAIINVIMDPILIFGLIGFPAMGVKGAAVATIFGQLCAAGLALYFNVTKNKEITLHWSKLRPEWRIIKEIYGIGIPSIVLQSIGSLMNFVMNQILIMFSTTAVATFGVYFKLQSFVFMPVFGMNNGVVPIAAYNYGARKKERLEEVMNLSVKYAIAIMTVGAIIFWIFPKQLLAIFSASPEMVAMGTVALRIMSLVFPFAAFCIMRGAIFQALGKSVYSMYISICRQLVVIIPAAWLLAKIGGSVDYVWWAFPIAEGVGTGMSILFTRKIRRDIIDHINDEKIDIKKALRQETKLTRDGLSDEYKRIASDKIQKTIIESDSFTKANTVLLYMATSNEVATDAILEACRQSGKRVCAPLCVADGIMEARLLAEGEALSKNKYGISEPGAESEAVAKGEIDLAIIPCVTCDDKCNRLGHGEGYYDRYLAGADFEKVALCYERLLVDDIPTHGNDIRMDAVVTEIKVYKKGKKGK